MTNIYRLTDEVLEKYGEDLLLEMTNPNTKDKRISINQVIKHDVLNIEIYGSITVDGKTEYYHVEDGNWNGTVFNDLSDEPIDIPRTRTIQVPKIVTALLELPLSSFFPILEAIVRELGEIQQIAQQEADRMDELLSSETAQEIIDKMLSGAYEEEDE